MYIDVKIEKLYLESALHGLSWKGKAYVIYLRNWTISSIACGELECITVGVKVSSLFCYRVLKSSSMISFWSFPWQLVPWLCDEKWSYSCSLAWAAPRCRRPLHDRHHNCYCESREQQSFKLHKWPCISLACISHILCFISHSHHLPFSPRLLSYPVHLCHCVTFQTSKFPISFVVIVKWSLIVSHLSFKFFYCGLPF